MTNFNLKLEAEIKYFYFFKGKNEGIDTEDDIPEIENIENAKLGLMKKNYCFVTTDNKLVIKNLGLRKKSNSELSKRIFWEYLVPEIKKGKIKFQRIYIQQLINELLSKDLTLAAMRKEVSNYDDYVKSPTSLPAQISKKYGAGIHMLIPNLKGVGVGIGKSYCTIQEFQDRNMKIEDINLENIWSELSYFITQPITKNIFDF